MKKIIYISIILSSLFAQSQISVTKLDGTPINNGQVVAFNTIWTTSNTSAELGFKVINSSSTETRVKINCVSLLNNDGTNFQLCFGPQCLPEVIAGDSYPDLPVTIAGNSSTGNADHFLNENSGTGTYPLDFNFRFYQISSTGTPTGNSVDMTYRYNPNLSIDDINQLETSGVLVKNTMIDNLLVLDVLKNTNLSIYDLNGNIVYTTKLEYGIKTIDISTFNSTIYLLNFTNEEGNTSTKKIIKM